MCLAVGIVRYKSLFLQNTDDCGYGPVIRMT